jgi:AraC-like DNA-binding protein
MGTIIKEITPLTLNDCFTVSSRLKKNFSFPLHYHEEFELSLIINAEGAQRVVGDSKEVISDIELVLIGPNLAHTFLDHQCTSEAITELTLHFHKDLFEEKFLKRNQLVLLKQMLENASRGVLFSHETATQLSGRLLALNELQGFTAVMELMGMLNELSVAPEVRLLSDTPANNTHNNYPISRRIEKAIEYMNTNFQKQITLKDLSRQVSMTEVSFSRFIKTRTGDTFVDTLNEIRLGHASRMLIETPLSIAEISNNCGFNNISNFNRVFKKKKHCTPKEFRENFSGKRTFI